MTPPRPGAVVTGAGSGIGAAIIATRLSATHDLLLTHLQPDPGLDRVLGDCRGRGAATTVVTGDLTTCAVATRLAETIQRTARLEVVVSCAGAYPRIAWSDTTIDLFQRQLQLNLVTHAALARAATVALTAAGPRGRFITISSVLTQLGRVDVAGYLAAKAGLEGLTRALA